MRLGDSTVQNVHAAQQFLPIKAGSRQLMDSKQRACHVCTFLNLAAASECEMCAATPPVVASAASSTRKKRKSALVTVYPPRSEEYCDLQFEAKSKRGGKEETSVSRKYCRWKAEYGVREVRCFCLHVASISVELSAGVYCPTLCVARAKLVGRDHDGNTRHASLSNHCPCGFLSALLLVSALLCLLHLTQRRMEL